MTGAVAAAAVLVAVLMWWQHRRHAQRVADERGALFDEVRRAHPLATVTRRGADFPVLRAPWRGRVVSLHPVPDTLGFRTVPTLWVSAVVAQPAGLTGRLSILAREHGSEFWSRHRECGVLVKGAPGDQHVSMRSERPEDLPPDVVDGCLDMLRDDRVKQVDVRPGSLRLVWRVASADRSTYRVTRAADFSGARMTEQQFDDLTAALERLREIVEVGSGVAR